MMGWVNAAVAIGGAVVGAVGNKKAGDAAAKGQENASDALVMAANRARQEIIPRFEAAIKGIDRTSDQSLNLLGRTNAQVNQPFLGGNRLAQEQVGRGLEQTQNAILGKPLDLSGFQARDVPVPGPIDVNQYINPPQATAPQQTVEEFLAGIQQSIGNSTNASGINFNGIGNVGNLGLGNLGGNIGNLGAGSGLSLGGNFNNFGIGGSM